MFKNEDRLASPASTPVAKVKGIWKNASKSRRIVLSLMLLLAVILGLVTSVSIFSSITNAHSKQQALSHGTPIDYLWDEQNEWPHSPTYVFDKKGQYHIQNKSITSIATAFYGTGSNGNSDKPDQFANFRLSVTVSEISGIRNGGDYYGVILRSSADEHRYYLFEITASGGGQYVFFHYDDGQTKQERRWERLAIGPLNSLSPNLGQTNVITIEAKGNSFNFFVNNRPVGKPVIDNTGDAFTSGEIGLSVEGKDTEVVFSNLHIQKL